MVNKINLLNFLVKAHKNTYAAPAEIKKKYRTVAPAIIAGFSQKILSS